MNKIIKYLNYLIKAKSAHGVHSPYVYKFIHELIETKNEAYYQFKELDRVRQELFKNNKYTDYLYLHGLSVESAEALAEYVHALIRKELGIHGADSPIRQDVFRQGYQGSRYSFGYPACPNLEDHTKLFQLLPAEKIGISLTEEFQLVPEQSTSAIVVHHPRAKYFNI